MKNYYGKLIASNGAEAQIIIVSGSEKRNYCTMVYRATVFRLPGESSYWELMKREYGTLKGLVKAAKRRGVKYEITGGIK